MKHSKLALSLSSTSPIVLTAVMALGAFGTLACKNSSSSSESATYDSGRVDLSNDLTAKAVVIAIDKAERLMTLRREDGSIFLVEASPDVRNFDQIELNDTLRVRYHESLAATRLLGSTSTTPAEATFVGGRAAIGEKPAAGVGVAARARVKIESIDHTNHIVVYSLDSGELRTVRAQRPEGREFIDNLKIGDIVQIDYTRSLALAIDEM